MDSLFENRKAEQSVIGLILKHEEYWKLIPQLTEEDLAFPEHRLILNAMKWIHLEKKPVDFVTVGDQLRKTVPAEKLNDVRIIREAALRRKMLDVLQESRCQLVETDTDTAAVLDKTRQSLRDLIVTGHSWETMTEVLTAAMDQIEKRSQGEDKGMPSGIATLDQRTMGFHKGELTIIGARPAVGKSAFAAQIALETARKGYKVGICSREMTDVQYGIRIFTKESDIDSNHLRSGRLEQKEWIGLAKSVEYLTKLPVSFIFSSKNIEDLRMEAQKKVDAGDLDLLIVDYAQLMQSRQKFDKDYLRIGYISKMLKDMTTDLNISVIALAQVARSTENEMPSLSELRGSGDLEQDADNVIFLHRPKDSSDKHIPAKDQEVFNLTREGNLQYILVDIAKQRQGDIGRVGVIFDPSRMRYLAIDTEE